MLDLENFAQSAVCDAVQCSCLAVLLEVDVGGVVRVLASESPPYRHEWTCFAHDNEVSQSTRAKRPSQPRLCRRRLTRWAAGGRGAGERGSTASNLRL